MIWPLRLEIIRPLAVPYWRLERQRQADLSGFVGERLSGIKDIQTNGAVTYTMQRFHEVLRQTFWQSLKADVITDIGWTLSKVVFSVGMVTAMGLGAYLFQRNIISIGTVYLVIHYLAMLNELLNGVQAVKVAVAEGPAVQRFDQLGQTRRRAVLKDRTFEALLQSLNATAVSISTGLILILAANLMRTETFTVGDFALFVSYTAAGAGGIADFVRWSGRKITALKQSDVSLKRLFELLPDATRPRLVDSESLYLRGSLPEVPEMLKADGRPFVSLQVPGTRVDLSSSR